MAVPDSRIGATLAARACADKALSAHENAAATDRGGVNVNLPRDQPAVGASAPLRCWIIMNVSKVYSAVWAYRNQSLR